MRSSDDRKRMIYDIQRRLLCLHNAGMPLPEIVPDGIYGKETKNAVSVFQSLNKLPVTGKVDEATWNTLFRLSDRAMRACERSAPIYPYEYMKRGTVSPEERSDLTYIVQIILRTLETQYPALAPQPLNGICDEITSKNISYLQTVWGLDGDGSVDLPTWNMLAQNYNLFLNRE